MAREAKATYSREFGGAKISPQGDILAIMNVSEAGLGLRRGEVRGLKPDQAQRMFALKTAIPYTEAAEKHAEKLRRDEAKAALDEQEIEDTEGDLPGFEGLKV